MQGPRNGLILAAEDDEDDQLLIAAALARMPSPPEVRFVGDGRELLDYLARRGEWADPARSPSPDLVLLDLNLPRTSGREALGALKQDPGLRRIPVVVLTTSEDPRDVHACYDAGANAYVCKPSSLPELTRALGLITEFWLRLARRSDAG